MSLLAPLFLLGLLTIAAPVLFHLVRRTTRDRTRFGSLMFLQPSPPRLRQRSRLEHWLLLLLRAAALAVLALAFARPFFRSLSAGPSPEATGPRVAILLDTSASMSRDGMMDAAREAAEREAEAAGANAEVAILRFDRAAVPLLDFDAWRESPPEARIDLVRSRLAGAEPSSSGTALASALMAAAEMLAHDPDESAAARERSIVLISDMQEGADLSGLQAYEWPSEVGLRVISIAAESPGNAGIQLAAAGRGQPGTTTDGVRVRVSNSSDATVESFQTGWSGPDGTPFAGTAVDVFAPPGQSRIVTIPWPEGGPRAGSLRLRGDSAEFDNLVYTVPPDPVKATVFYAGPDTDGAAPGPLFFLRRALPQSRTVAVDLVTAPAAPASLDDAVLCVVTGPLDDATARAIAARTEAGGTTLLALTSSEMAPTLAALAGSGAAIPLTDVKPDRYAMLGTIDFRHPVFLPFADPRFSDFTGIRFWNYRRFDASALPGAHVVAQFDSGDPAIVEVPRGDGRLLALASGWQTAQSQLALSSKFPSLVASLLDTTGAVTPPAPQFTAGDPVPRSALAPERAENVRVSDPAGSESPLAAGESFTPDRPGLYRTTWDGGSRPFAVNLEPSESRTGPLPVEDLERLGLPLTVDRPETPPDPSAEALAGAVEAENRQKLWRWCIAVALAVLFAETFLAGWTARRSSARTAAG